MLTDKEIQIAKDCIAYAVANGADAARVTLSKSVTDGCSMFNGSVDKVTHSADRSIYIYLFVEGRYGTFSTNRLETRELEDFIRKAIAMVRMLGEDRCRQLPDASRTEKNALTGQELRLYDPAYEAMDIDRRLDNARRLSIYPQESGSSQSWKLISEDCEYTDCIDDSFTADSQGFEGRHTETSFTCFTEMTIESPSGDKYSGHWWESSPQYSGLAIESCGKIALERAVRQAGPRKRRSGKYRMVVESSAAARLVSPLFSALNASAIQQKMSFLADTLGRRVFSEGLTIRDMARTCGKPGARLFDTEGVATRDSVIIGNGIVNEYFVNTFMANKTGMEPTVEDISRPCMEPYLKGKDLTSAEKELSLNAIMRHCANGILVTGFNGGNCNPATGDFSFGIEGFAFSRGKIVHPVREMLITGNMLTLWNSLTAVGSDARQCTRWQIPSLAFEGVSFSA